MIINSEKLKKRKRKMNLLLYIYIFIYLVSVKEKMAYWLYFLHIEPTLFLTWLITFFNKTIQ